MSHYVIPEKYILKITELSFLIALAKQNQQDLAI